MDEFSKKINLFKLNFEGEKRIYKYSKVPESENSDYFNRRGNFYYSMKKLDNYEEVQFNPRNIHKMIVNEFRSKLLKSSYELDGRYVAYKKDSDISSRKDIFSMFDGFEYRFTPINDDLFLNIDYKLVIKNNASIQKLLNLNAREQTLINNSVELRMDDGEKSNGRLIKANENECIVNFFEEGTKTVSSNDVYPICRPELLKHILKSIGISINVISLQRNRSLIKPKIRLNKIKIIAKRLHNEGIFPLSIENMTVQMIKELVPIEELGFSHSHDFTSEELEFDSSYDGFTLKCDDKLIEPKLQFAEGYYNDKPWPTEYPPYSSLDKLSIVLYYPKDKNDNVIKLMKGLNRQLTRFFKVKNIEIDYHFIEHDPFDDNYVNEIKDHLKFLDKVDLGIIYLPEAMRYYSQSPYYTLKAYFSSLRIPTQMITEKSFKSYNGLNFTLLNMGTAITAKCGGIPWVLRNKLKETDIIIGMSFSSKLSNIGENNQKNRYVGFANVFNSYGKWFYSCGTAKEYDKYAEIDQITEIIKDIKKYFSQSEFKSPKNIIFHSSKRMNFDLKKSIYSLIRDEFGRNCKCAFIIIDESHNYRSFDTDSFDGSLPRGYFIYLSDYKILLSTTGTSNLRKQGLGTPRLLHISVSQFPKKFLSLEDVAEQVLALTKLNWSSVTPVQREPVTINYANKLANIATHIDPEKWNKSLFNRPWFV